MLKKYRYSLTSKNLLGKETSTFISLIEELSKREIAYLGSLEIKAKLLMINIDITRIRPRRRRRCASSVKTSSMISSARETEWDSGLKVLMVVF